MTGTRPFETNWKIDLNISFMLLRHTENTPGVNSSMYYIVGGSTFSSHIMLSTKTSRPHVTSSRKFQKYGISFKVLPAWKFKM